MRLTPKIDGATPLHAAVQSGSREMVKLLLVHRARICDVRKVRGVADNFVKPRTWLTNEEVSSYTQNMCYVYR